MRYTSAILAVFAAPCAAQLGASLPNANFPLGTHVLNVQNIVRSATGIDYDGMLGVARTRNGRYWVTARRAPRLPATNPHVLFEFDQSGNLAGTYPVPNSAVSQWGLRDLAYDGDRHLFGGWEGDRVLAFDVVTRSWNPSRDFVLPTNRTFGVPRALAFDPNGDSGRGSLWTANWDSEHVEFDRLGNILRRRPNLQPDTYGAARDPVRGTIWWFGQSGGGRPDVAVVATEMDLATLQPTGQVVLGDRSFPGITAGGFAGGAEFYETAGRTVLLLGAQTDQDVVYELWGRFDFGPSSGGAIGFDGGAAYVGNTGFGIRLDRSAQGFGVLLTGFGEARTPLLPPLFAAGSILLIDPSSPIYSQPPQIVAGGSARQPLPIPADPSIAGLDLYMQWVEYTQSAGVPILPLRISNGGKIRILP